MASAAEIRDDHLDRQKEKADEYAFRKDPLAWLTRLWLVGIAFFSAGLAFASVPHTQSAASLHAQHASLAERLQHNPFQRALALDSSESSSDLKGDIYALVDYPFSTFSAALNGAEGWCDVLILHINTKYCRATTDETRTVLTVYIGKKTPQPIKDAFPIEFTYRVTTATANYLDIQLDAEKGPLSTRDYHIQLQAVPVGNGQTFLHLTYSYAYGLAGRLAMKTYLATLGSGKVGFTIIGRQSSGQPEYIGGMRGVAERNTMRYYLAIDTFMGTLAEPPIQLQKRLHRWFSATEQYPRQLHEVSRTAYMDMKRSEYLRQQTAQSLRK
ncbi:MAG: hypothetical protein U0938_02380 [Thiobacillus sp.]|nr:hypothetical protein [Thiobacillus sp.]